MFFDAGVWKKTIYSQMLLIQSISFILKDYRISLIMYNFWLCIFCVAIGLMAVSLLHWNIDNLSKFLLTPFNVLLSRWWRLVLRQLMTAQAFSTIHSSPRASKISKITNNGRRIRPAPQRQQQQLQQRQRQPQQPKRKDKIHCFLKSYIINNDITV